MKHITYTPGQRVVIAAKTQFPKNANETWVGYMDRYIGQEGTVLDDRGPCYGVQVEFDNDQDSWWFPHSSLEVAKTELEKADEAVRVAAYTLADAIVARLRLYVEAGLLSRLMRVLGDRKTQDAWADSRGYMWDDAGVLVYKDRPDVKVCSGK